MKHILLRLAFGKPKFLMWIQILKRSFNNIPSDLRSDSFVTVFFNFRPSLKSLGGGAHVSELMISTL